MASVYKHTSPEGKVYIGICHTDNIKCIKRDRWQLKGQGYKQNKLFWEDIQKFGWENFQHEIIATEIEEEEELINKEKEFIRLYNSDNPKHGYNKRRAYRAIRCLDTGEIFNSMKDATNATGISSSSLSACCSGKTKTAGKLHWEYYNQEEEQ